EIGQFAGAGDRAPQFGAALAAIGGEGESDAPQPRTRAGAEGLGAAPLILHCHYRLYRRFPSLPGLTRQSISSRKSFGEEDGPAGHKRVFDALPPAGDTYGYAAVRQMTRRCDYGAAAMTASS